MSNTLKPAPKRKRSPAKPASTHTQDLARLIEAYRASGASEVTLPDGTVLKFASTPPQPKPMGVVPELKPEDLIKPESVFDQYSEEEILFWSTDYYDELQARKEAQQQAAKERE